MNLDIRVFQATATVIPTLVIALLITSRLFDRLVPRKELKFDSRPLTVLIACVTAAVYGEICSLMIVAQGGQGSRLVQAIAVLSPIVLIGMLLSQVVVPVFKRYGKKTDIVLNIGFVLAFLVAPVLVVYFGILLPVWNTPTP